MSMNDSTKRATETLAKTVNNLMSTDHVCGICCDTPCEEQEKKEKETTSN